MLCTILPLAAAALLFRPNYQPQGFGFTVIRTLVTLAALFVAEPLLLHFWGTTPGKWLLGLSVESEAAGLRLFCEAEYAGEPTAFGLTAAEDGEPPCLKLVFRVTEAGM